MKIIGGVLLALAIVMAGFGLTRTAEKHPYAIDSLMSHVDKNGKITVEKQLPEQKGFKSFVISYYSENLKEYALMNMPTGQMPGSGWPVVIVNHGHVTPNIYSTINSYKNTSAYYAKAGFLVLKPDYRGHDKSEGKAESIVSRQQYVVDVLNLLAAVKSLPEANINKIYLYGHSMGGDVALMMAEVSDQIKGVSLWAPAVSSFPESVTYFRNKNKTGVTDNLTYQGQLDQLIKTYGSNQFSALVNTDKVKAPIIIQQSITDESVPYSWGVQLNEILKTNGKKVNMFSYPNDNHDIAGHFGQALGRDVEFFRGN